ncbi:TniQ family protein [Peribacillus sp. NPDC096540]|uniref:TniQ family protein n=1 Tax=Peribacillus sp. NPDC096540 TaxID=3390612 RepID=UPI003D02BA2B
MENELFSTEDIQLSNSSLYNLKPMELGTFHCESMTSYITRLAEVHCIKLGTLVNKVIAPTLNKDFILQSAKRGGNRFYDGAKALNGVSKSSKDLVEAVEKLTLRNDLMNLNLTKWEEVLTCRGLMKESLSWCPSCLREFRNKYGYEYFPLLWFIKPVKYCYVHQTKLITKCEDCKKGIPVLHRNSLNGRCPYCNSNLINKVEDKDDNELEKQLFIAKSIGEIISISYTLTKSVSRNHISSRLNQIITNYFDRNRIKLREQLGVPNVTFFNWTRGDSIPPLDKLLDICYLLGFSLKDFLFDTEKIPCIKKEVLHNHIPLEGRRKLDYKKIEKSLLNYLKSNEPISMAGVAKEVGVNKRLLYENLPNLSKALSDKYKDHISSMSYKRKKGVTELIEIGVTQLINTGELPTQKRIENQLSLNCLLRESFAKEHLVNIVENLE